MSAAAPLPIRRYLVPVVENVRRSWQQPHLDETSNGVGLLLASGAQLVESYEVVADVGEVGACKATALCVHTPTIPA